MSMPNFNFTGIRKSQRTFEQKEDTIVRHFRKVNPEATNLMNRDKMKVSHHATYHSDGQSRLHRSGFYCYSTRSSCLS